MTVDLTKHAEEILRAAFPSMNFELTTLAAKQPRTMDAVRALFDAGALAMRQASYRACLDCQSEPLNNRGSAALDIRKINPASLRESV